MADDGNEDQEEYSNNKEDLKLSKVLKQNRQKIGLLESGQQEILNQLRFLIEKMGK